MASAVVEPSTLLIHYDQSEPPNVSQIRQQLENGSEDDKIAALKTVILLTLNGGELNNLLMTVLRFVMPSRNHVLKKLLLVYWEVIPKTENGKPRHEMILVCNALRNDINDANEYIRGSTLRFLCKLKEPELLEPLLPSIRNNLEYRHSYVRRNAVLAVYRIYSQFEHLIPDAPELIFNFLSAESDASCKRNAFIMLFNCAQDKAVEYLSTCLDQVGSFNEILQIIVVELIRKVVRSNPGERSKYIRCIFQLLASPSSAVQYESAGTLIALSTAPSAVRQAAAAYIKLLCKESDNNVKMIVLDRLLALKQNHGSVLSELLLDILRALATPNVDIRKKTLDLALDLVTPKNIDEVIMVLKKEVAKTQAKELEKQAEYRQMLINAIHACAVKFPEVASNVVHLLMDFLGDSNVASAVDVIVFVREVVQTYAHLRESIIRKLLQCMYQIKSSKVFRSTLWIIGEYCHTEAEIEVAFNSVKEALGDCPFVESDDQADDTETDNRSDAPVKPKASQPRVLADGTYASQSALIESYPSKTDSSESTPLRALLLNGDFYLGTAIASSITKMAAKLMLLPDVAPAKKNKTHGEVLLILVSMLHLGKSSKPQHPIDADSHDRICLCLRVLSEPSQLSQDALLQQPGIAFQNLLDEQAKIKPAAAEKEKVINCQADDQLVVRLLRNKRAQEHDDLDDEDDAALSRATGMTEAAGDAGLKLNRIVQLTGFSDPIYAEALVIVHQYDIVLDVLVINQTADTLQNLNLELATLGDLKLVERPQNYTVAPMEKLNIKANIKVSSTETGIIFGNIVYDIAGAAADSRNCVILNDIHIDIMDYINPATCSDVQFRTMWSEFEWENKVAVNTTISDVDAFLQHIIASTNMKCLTPPNALAGECGFVSANLYAKSIFEEDALANVSIESVSDAATPGGSKIAGFIRIRSKTQGIALSLGDKITLKQRPN